MKNIIIVGDSFCSSATEWPTYLANYLDLNLISYGQGGQPWWSAKKFIDTISNSDLDNTDVMIFVHTNAERIPTSNQSIGLIDHSSVATNEIAQAVQLYYKYIFDPEFINWAQQSWFLEINRRFAHKQVVHLHSFPWSRSNEHLLAGLNITTNLCAISLNELGAKEFTLFNDTRANHLNNHNNRKLAQQLAERIKDYRPQSVELDVSEFEQATLKWLDWH